VRHDTSVDFDFTRLGERRWLDAHNVSATTYARNRSHLDIHILRRFGDTPLDDITRMAVKRWVKDLGRSRADSTVAGISPWSP
jgi:hypothetical protein